MVMKRFTQAVVVSVLLCLSGTVIAANQYVLAVSNGIGGTVQISVSFGNVAKAWDGSITLLIDEGSQVKLDAVANPGYHFARWMGVTSFNSPVLTFDMSQDWALQAIF